MEYKVSELADKAGVTKRTIHYYISKGLLLPPEGSGVNSVYNEAHLERLLLIKKLQSKYLPLDKIREYILKNPKEIVKRNENTSISKTSQETLNATKIGEKYIRENVCNIFEMHYSEENAEKYNYIIENVKKYVKKMMED